MKLVTAHIISTAKINQALQCLIRGQWCVIVDLWISRTLSALNVETKPMHRKQIRPRAMTAVGLFSIESNPKAKTWSQMLDWPTVRGRFV